MGSSSNGASSRGSGGRPEPSGGVAFIRLLDAGWWTGVGCPDRGGTGALFRDAVREGERFLAERPDSEHRVLVSFVLAQAYETWWSVSLAENDTYVMDPGAYREGAEEARGRAVELYGRIRALAPGSDRAVYAAMHLPRLRMGLDTGQRRFYCVYD